MATLIEREERTLTRQSEHDRQLETYRRRNRTLRILVVLMAAVLVAMVAWVVFDATRSSDVAPTAAIEQLFDDDTKGARVSTTAAATIERCVA